jgi:MFS transporter, SP family, xylose:H+ symportor
MDTFAFTVLRMNSLAVRSTIVAALDGPIFGFDTAVICGTTDALKEVFHLSDSGLGFTRQACRSASIRGGTTRAVWSQNWRNRPAGEGAEIRIGMAEQGSGTSTIDVDRCRTK